MSAIIKTMKAAELPQVWQRELGVAGDQNVRVALEAIEPSRSPEEVERLLEELAAIEPLRIDGDITDFVRSERDRLDGRGVRLG